MAAPEKELADALVSDLNNVSRGWTFPFTAERVHVPVWDGEQELEPGNLACFVSPWADVQTESLDRSNALYRFEIDIGFAMRLEAQYRETIDDLRNLVHTAVKRYVSLDITVNGLGKFVPLRRTSLYVTLDPSQLHRQLGDDGKVYYTGDFVSVFRVPYRFLELD